MSEEVDRRDFMKTAGVGAGAALTVGWNLLQKGGRHGRSCNDTRNLYVKTPDSDRPDEVAEGSGAALTQSLASRRSSSGHGEAWGGLPSRVL